MNRLETSPLRIAIVGAGGYSGAELVNILLRHPRAEIVGLFGSSKRDEGPQQLLEDIFPRFRGRLKLPVTAAEPGAIAALKPDAVFLATPHEASEALASPLLKTGACVLDLSAAFRFRDAGVYPLHYGFAHTHPDLLATAVYGLPELFRSQLPSAKLIAVPGCYPTSAILPLAPLVREGAIAKDSHGRLRRPIIDATSGVSGAGRSAKVGSLFCEVSLQPYGVLKHRHQPEIDTYAGVETVFTPHLGSFDRGILSTIHVELASDWTAEKVRTLYEKTYAHERFVRLCAPGIFPAIADVCGSNYCDFGWALDEKHGHLIIASAIDNLVKGAAGQAVQAMNARFGLDEGWGLLDGSFVR